MAGRLTDIYSFHQGEEGSDGFGQARWRPRKGQGSLDYWPWGLFVGAALFLGVELYLGEWHADTREAWGEYLAFEKTVGPNGDGMTEVEAERFTGVITTFLWDLFHLLLSPVVFVWLGNDIRRAKGIINHLLQLNVAMKGK